MIDVEKALEKSQCHSDDSRTQIAVPDPGAVFTGEPSKPFSFTTLRKPDFLPDQQLPVAAHQPTCARLPYCCRVDDPQPAPPSALSANLLSYCRSTVVLPLDTSTPIPSAISPPVIYPRSKA